MSVLEMLPAYALLGIPLGLGIGLALGLVANRDDGWGGYGSFRRRSARLGHIAAVMLPLLAGFYALSVRPDGLTGEIELMFVEPGRMRRGIGRALWDHLIETARTIGLSRILIDADPFAEPFYRAMGARRTGESPSSSIPGRMLPRLEVELG